MPPILRNRPTETQLVFAVYMAVLAALFVYESGFTAGMLRMLFFVGFLVLLVAGVSASIQVVLRQRVLTRSTVLPLIFGVAVSIFAAVYRGINLAAWVAFGLVAGLLVGLVVGVLFKYRRKP